MVGKRYRGCFPFPVCAPDRTPPPPRLLPPPRSKRTCRAPVVRPVRLAVGRAENPRLTVGAPGYLPPRTPADPALPRPATGPLSPAERPRRSEPAATGRAPAGRPARLPNRLVPVPPLTASAARGRRCPWPRYRCLYPAGRRRGALGLREEGPGRRQRERRSRGWGCAEASGPRRTAPPRPRPSELPSRALRSRGDAAGSGAGSPAPRPRGAPSAPLITGARGERRGRPERAVSAPPSAGGQE